MIRYPLIALLAAASFHASAAGPINHATNPGQLTRAEVRADLQRAIAAGELVIGDQQFQPRAHGPALSRSGVVATLERAQASGRIVYGDHNHVIEPQGRALTRAEVRNSLRLARAQGRLIVGDVSEVPPFHPGALLRDSGVSRTAALVGR